MLENQNLYVFVKRGLPITSHNLQFTKTFSSAAYTQALLSPEFREKYLLGSIDYLPYVANPRRDLMPLSQFCVTAVNDYRIEYDAEVIRARHFPGLPSRLSAVYAFDSYESCKTVSKKHGWPLETVRRFRLEYDDLTRIARVNMEVVSLARTAYLTSAISQADVEALWTHYWSGAGNAEMVLPIAGFRRKRLRSGVIWELLIEGRITCVDP